MFAWEHGVWKAPKQNAWAKRNAKQNALGQLHLDCHGLPEGRSSKKKSRFKTLMKTMPEPYDFDHSGLGRVGEYFPNFLIKTHRGSMEKVKTL